MKILSVLLFPLLVVGSWGAAKRCPAIEVTFPCKCRNDVLGPEVTCSKLEDEVALKKALQSLKGTAIDKMSIKNLNASIWEEDLFEGIQVDTLVLEKVEVDHPSFRPGQKHFQGLEKSLRQLEIYKSFKNGHALVNLRIDHLESLQDVFTERNSIPEIGNDWYPVDSPNLTNLILDDNGIESLGDQAFSSLTNLRLLAMSGNHIRDISRSMLPKSAEKLRQIDISHNKLYKIPTNLFSDFPSLTELDLSHNLIQTLDENTFKPLYSQGVAVSINGNPLVCDDSLKWVCAFKEEGNLYAKCVSPEEQRGKKISKFCRDQKA